MDPKELERAGLTHNEAKVYLCLVHSGGSASGELMSATGISGSKIYESLIRLQQKGLVGVTKSSSKKRFIPTEPARLLDHIDERKRVLEEEREKVHALIPAIEAIRKSPHPERQGVEMYQGLKGYRTLLENMLHEISPGGTYLVIASGMLKEVLGNYWHVFQQKKREHLISSRCVWDAKVRLQKAYLDEYYGEGRFISGGRYLGPVDVWIYSDKVIQISYAAQPLFAVLITSKSLASSYRELFETLWTHASQDRDLGPAESSTPGG